MAASANHGLRWRSACDPLDKGWFWSLLLNSCWDWVSLSRARSVLAGWHRMWYVKMARQC